jgi:hypothetical protein
MNITFNIKFQLNKLYYRYIDASAVNHYKLLLLTEEYRNITKYYFNKYPNAEGFINLNKRLFDSNKQAEIEYMDYSKKQAKIKKAFFENREIICKNNKNKHLIICSDSFEDFYDCHKYHFGECTENIIDNIITDIRSMDKN